MLSTHRGDRDISPIPNHPALPFSALSWFKPLATKSLLEFLRVLPFGKTKNSPPFIVRSNDRMPSRAQRELFAEAVDDLVAFAQTSLRWHCDLVWPPSVDRCRRELSLPPHRASRFSRIGRTNTSLPATSVSVAKGASSNRTLGRSPA